MTQSVFIEAFSTIMKSLPNSAHHVQDHYNNFFTTHEEITAQEIVGAPTKPRHTGYLQNP